MMDDLSIRLNAELSADLRSAESLLQDVIASTSVDVFGSTVKSFLDKSIVFAVAGLLISTIGVFDQTASFGPFKVRIEYTWIVQISIALMTFYYAAAAAVLARTDYRRWSATYNLKIPSITSLGERLQDVIRRDMADFKEFGNEIMLRVSNGEFQDTADGDVPDPLKKMAQDVAERADIVSVLIKQITNPGRMMRRQATIQSIVFVIFPLMFSLISFLVCIISGIRTLNSAV